MLIGLGILGLLAARGASAQDLSILDPQHTQLISQEISGDAAYGHVRFMTQFHRPRGGSDGLWSVAEYVAEKATEFGLSDVQLIKQASRTRPWNASFADLWIVEPEPERLASTLQSVLHLADYSRPTDVMAELIDIGAGQEADYQGKDVAGKIVLTYGSASGAMREAVWNRGALGVVWYPSPFASDIGISGAGFPRPDQLRWISIPSRGSDGNEPTFAFGLSLRQGVLLRNRLAQAREPITVRAVVESSMDSQQGSEPWQVMVEAFIRGTEPTLGQDIVLTGHLQEEGTSANDDASGVASALEVARALNRLITDGIVPRPRRNIRFWWVTEISSQRQYFADNPDAHRQMWVNINQDMVGANQAQDVMRKQNITRLPAARFHFFNDVVESVVEYMVAANNFELAQLQTGIALYPKPHLAHLGTQHRYNAAMIYNHNSTDHMTFNEAPIGVPGVTFTNMPDRYIHSSDDDLWNIDPTQLGRSAAAVGLMAYIMAAADSAAVPALGAATAGRGFERLGRNVRLALSWIAGASDRDAAFREAVDQVWFATQRERSALISLEQIHPSATAFVDPLLQELDRREAQALREVGLVYRQLTGKRQLPRASRSATEERLAELQPVLVAGPAEFLTGRGQVSFVPGIHSLMRFEVLNAVDGKRSGLDIARFVAAEAREAGEIYYGTVTPEAVLQYLTNLEEAQLIQLVPGAEYSRALSLVREGQELVRAGSVTEAVSRYRTAQRRSGKLHITAPSWNTLCWWGGLWNQAAEVVSACDRAVELAPDNADFKDSRGLVRALTGDTEGAIQDFEAFIASSSDAERVTRRQAWIEALRAGQQPITEDVLVAERE
jgi:hypothetical protein